MSLPQKKNIRPFLFLAFILLGAGFYYVSYVTIDGKIIQLESSMQPNSLPDLAPPGETKDPIEKEQEEVRNLFEIAIPENPTLPLALSEIARRAKLTGIEALTLKTRESRMTREIDGKSQIYLWPIIVSFESDYYQLAEFIHEIEMIERTTAILEIKIKRAPPGLKAKVELAVYSLTAPPPVLHPEKDQNEMDPEEPEYG